MMHALIRNLKQVLIRFARITRWDVLTHDITKDFKDSLYVFNRVNSRTIGIQHSDFGSISIRNQSSDLLVLDQVLKQKEYEPLVSMVEEFGHKEKVKFIIDAGANIGISSRYMASQFRQAAVYAIEPDADNFSFLAMNTRTEPRIKAVNAALWNEDAELHLKNDFRDKMEWSVRVDNHPGEGLFKVPGYSLDTLMRQFGLNDVDILKIDIEGAEAVLFGSPDFLRGIKKTKFLAIELHEEFVDRISIINLLQDIGFTLRFKGETLFGVNRAAFIL